MRIKSKILSQENKIENPIIPNVNIFPFSISLGTSNSSELGILPHNIKVNDFATFKRVFTGINTIVALWDEAYSYTRNIELKALNKIYKVGTYFKCQIPNTSHSSYFSQNSIDSSFLNQFDSETVNIFTLKEIQEEDIFKFYIIPSKMSEKWLYVTNASNYYKSNGKFSHSELTLESVADKLESSGMAIEQYVHRTPAAGQGYAWPVEEPNGDVKLDEERKKDIPINSIQLEVEGLAAFSSVVCYGRPVLRDSNGNTQFYNYVNTPRMLFPYSIETPRPSPVNTKPTYESEYYFLEKAYAKLQERQTDWKKFYGNASYLSGQIQNSFNGVLEVEEQSVKDSNPLVNGSFKHTIYDNDWKIIMKHNYNVETDDKTIRQLALRNKELTIAQILFFNAFINSKYVSLPLTKEHNVMWDFSSLPIIGGFLSRLTFGIPFGWKDTRLIIKNDGMNWLIPAGVVDYMNKRFVNAENTTTIDLNVFNNGSNITEEALYSGINSMGTILKFALTDLFEITLNNEKFIFNTSYLGNEIPIADYNGKSTEGISGKLLINETCKPVPPIIPGLGYVIDSIQDHTLAQTNIRYSLFSNDFPVWSGTYKTKSKFTGNIRDIMTIRKLSDIKEDNDNVIDYPKSIVSPTPTELQPEQTLPIIQIKDLVNSFYNVQPWKTTWTVNNSSFRTYARSLKVRLSGEKNVFTYVGGATQYKEFSVEFKPTIINFITKTIHIFKITDINPNVNQFFLDYQRIVIDTQTIELSLLKNNPNKAYKVLEQGYLKEYILDIGDKTEIQYRNIIAKLNVSYNGISNIEFKLQLIFQKYKDYPTKTWKFRKNLDSKDYPNAKLYLDSRTDRLIDRSFGFTIKNAIIQPKQK